MELHISTIEFRKLSVETATKWASSTHTLLHSVSGWCACESVTGIMGPSGAGKTTLLDTLAGVKLGGRASGAIRFGGMTRTRWLSQHTMSYVMQQDVLPLLDTPREAITTSALLRLPPSLPLQAKLERVEYLLELLDLQDCANLVMGDNTQGVRGISGGQRRRVTIGIELVKNPALIFLDEPLTGLDSEMADTVAACLSRLAREKGKTVVMSLHQASRRLYQHVDGLILMAAGHLVYCGPFDGAQPYLQSLGHSMLPDQTPAEFMSMVMRSWQVQGTAGTAVKAWDPPWLDGGLEKKEGAEGKDAGPKGMASLERAAAASWSRSPSLGKVVFQEQVQASFFAQVLVLIQRKWRWLRRARSSTLSMLATSLFAGVLIGLIYESITDQAEPGMYDRLALLWLIPAAMTFWFNNVAMFDWASHRQLLRREHGTRLYSISSYFAAHCFTWGLLILIKMVLFSPLYFIAGLQLRADKFFIFFAVLLLLACTCDLVGQVIVVAAPSWNAAVAIQSATAVLLMCSTGFLSEDIPSYMRWVKTASYITYTYNALALNEFEGLVLYNETGVADVPGLLEDSGLVQTNLGLGVNMAALACIMVGVLVLAFTTLWFKARCNQI